MSTSNKMVQISNWRQNLINYYISITFLEGQKMCGKLLAAIKFELVIFKDNL